MEMSADEVEHQATVDRGLKMKIKRKQSALKMAVDEDSVVSSAKTQPKQTTTTVYLDRRQTTTFEDEEAGGGGGGGGGAALKSQKRKRGNNRNGRQQRETTDERGGGEAECVQSRGRDLGCSGGVPRCKDSCGGAGSERSFNRRRPLANGQETERRNDSSDDQQQQQNRWCGGGRGGTDDPAEGTAEATSSAAAAAAVDVSLDSNFLTEEAFQSSDPYEFIVKVEDRPQTPAKKLKVDNKMDSEMFSSSSSSSSSCVASKAKCDVGTVTCSVGVMTDPDCIGPCEPGTSVILEGIVWSESNNGILVVNVTWRGKTYVGTLMDATRHHWASPRFREESPSMELEYRVPKSKRGTPITDEGRRPRKCRRTTNNGINSISSISSTSSSSSSSSGTKTTRQSPGPEPNGRQKGAGAGAGGGVRMTEAEKEVTSSEAPSSAKRSRMDSDECEDASFYKCKAPDCSKKFRHISGLRYHQSQAHKKQLHPGIVGGRRPDVAQEKGRTETKKEEDLPVAVVVVPDGAVDGLGQVLGYEAETETGGGGGGGGGGYSLESPKDENFSIPRTDVSAAAATEPDEKTEFLGLRGDDAPQRVRGTHGCFDAPVYLSTPEEEPVDSNPEGKSTVPPVKHSTGKILEVEREEAGGGQDDEVQPPVHAHAAAPDFQNTVKCSRADLENASSRETLRSLVAETDSGQHPDGRAAKSPSRPSDLFHKPSFLLHAPDVRKPKGVGHHHQASAERSAMHNAHFESVHSLSVSCPSSVGQLKLSPSAGGGGGGGNNDDRSPVYSDISDANDGGAAFSEHEGRFRRGSRDAKKPLKMEKPSSLRKYDDCIGSSSGHGGQSQNPSARLSSPSPSALLGSSCPPPPPNKKPSDSLKSREAELDQAKKTSGGAPPLLSSRSSSVSVVKPPVPPPDRYRVDKAASSGGAGGNFNVDMLKAQESGLLWMEMMQRANAVPYGYGVDPLAHMQLMSSNAEYRNHYERWYMGQQCYRQLLQAESEKCIGIDKPVDMSAKSAASTASNSSSDSKAMVKLHSKPTTNNVIADEGGSADRCRGPPSAASSTGFSMELNQNTGLDHHHHHHHHQHHHEENVQFRSKALLLPKQESVLLRSAEREEKPLDLMNAGGVNKAKAKQTTSEMTGSPSGHQPSIRLKAPSAFIADSSAAVASNQDFSKASPAAAQVRYEGNFPPHFPGFQGPAFLDPSLNAPGGGGGGGGGGGRYTVMNSKYPPTGSEKSSSSSGGQGRKTTGQTTTTPLLLMHSSSAAAKDLSPASSKSGDGGGSAAAAAAAAVRQNAPDGFEFSNDPSSAQDKAPAPLSSGHSSPLTLRHLHTHHHTHVVGAAPYSIYGSYNGLMSPVPTIVPSVVPVISPTYLPK